MGSPLSTTTAVVAKLVLLGLTWVDLSSKKIQKHCKIGVGTP